jgi:hypothetical protein
MKEFLQALSSRLNSKPILSFIIDTLNHRNRIDADIDLQTGWIRLTHQLNKKQVEFYVSIEDPQKAVAQFDKFFEEIRR